MISGSRRKYNNDYDNNTTKSKDNNRTAIATSTSINGRKKEEWIFNTGQL
jgi:hypothetical protein